MNSQLKEKMEVPGLGPPSGHVEPYASYHPNKPFPCATMRKDKRVVVLSHKGLELFVHSGIRPKYFY